MRDAQGQSDFHRFIDFVFPIMLKPVKLVKALPIQCKIHSLQFFVLSCLMYITNKRLTFAGGSGGLGWDRQRDIRGVRLSGSSQFITGPWKNDSSFSLFCEYT